MSSDVKAEIVGQRSAMAQIEVERGVVIVMVVRRIGNFGFMRRRLDGDLGVPIAVVGDREFRAGRVD